MAHFRKSWAVLGLSTASALALALGCGEIGSGGSTEGAVSDLTESPDLVISQVYGGGGNSGAPLTHDYVELFNRGTKAVSLKGKSLQVTGDKFDFDATKKLDLPEASIEPGGYFLVQLAATVRDGGAAGPDAPKPLPKADFEGDLLLGSKGGKVALVPSDKLLDACGGEARCESPDIIDFLGFGAASQSETFPLGEISNTTAATREVEGCKDTGSNVVDFKTKAPAPRNSASPKVDCAKLLASQPDGGPAGNSAALVLVNEVDFNPPGAKDAPYEYIELLCTKDAPLDGYYVAVVEGDSDVRDGGAAGPITETGKIDLVFDLAGKKCGKNGLVLIKAKDGGYKEGVPADTTVIEDTALDLGANPQSSVSRIENATTSFVVIKSPVPIGKGMDIDTKNDGNVDGLPPGALVVDGVGSIDQGENTAPDRTYGPAMKLPSGKPPHAVTRIKGNEDPMSAAAWYAGAFNGDDATADEGIVYVGSTKTTNAPNGACVTPGAENDPSKCPKVTGNPPSNRDGGTTTKKDGGKEDDDGEREDDTTDGEYTGDVPIGSTKRPTKTPPPQELGAVADCAMASGPAGTSTFGMFAGIGLALVSLARRRRR